MLNMNSPIVQNLMQSGFNPYSNNGYIPQQQSIQQNYGYNPYTYQSTQQDILDNWQYSYDPMPQMIVNEARGINSTIIHPSYSNNNYYGNNYYNSQVFNGYSNPILMKNQMENERIRQREEAIQQGKIWRILFKNQEHNENFDIDLLVEKVESMYYYEPPRQEIPIKEQIIIDKNNHIAELEARLSYYRQNNIPIMNTADMQLNNICNYYNRINDIIGDVNNCDMVDYFTRVYPELKYQEMMKDVNKYNKNLKNAYNTKDFNKQIINNEKPDSYYAKIMETFAETGVKLETSSGLIITPDEMEVKLPERLLKNRQDEYYEQRKKFFNSVFNKGGN